ncbi:MAG: hypothetical protein WBM50_19090 [Acidimicrobiales bacterium]
MVESEQPGLARHVTRTRLVMVVVALLVSLTPLVAFPTRPMMTASNQDLADRILPAATLVVEQDEAPQVAAEPQREPQRPPPPPLDDSPFFVSPDRGDNANAGNTIDAPWASLQFALDQLRPGDTLYLMEGTYDELRVDNFHYVMRNSGQPDAWIRVTAAPGHEPVLIPTEGTAFEVQANYVEVSNLTVRGEGFNETNSYGVGLSVRRSHHVRLLANVVSGMPLAGISCIESSNLEIIDNEIFENAFWSTAQGSGISIWHSLDWGQPPAADGYHDRILGNKIYRNENRVKSKWVNFTTITDGNGIIIDQNRDFNYTGRTLIANNVVFDNGGRAILVFESNRVDVIFNTTYHNGRTVGLDGGPVELAAGTATDVRFFNNLAWALPSAPAMRASGSREVTSGGNVLITTNPLGAGEQDLVLSVGPGVISPSTDERTADFRPEATGVLIDRAMAFEPALPYDIDGTDRPEGSADVGAYEIDVG